MRRPLLACLLLIAAAMGARAEFFPVTMRACGPDGKPAVGAEASCFWGVGDDGRMASFTDRPTDAEGRASVSGIDRGNRGCGLLVLSADRKFGGLVGVGSGDAEGVVPVTLGPTARLVGRVIVPELPGPAAPVALSVLADDDRGIVKPIVWLRLRPGGRFDFTLPAGVYKLALTSPDFEPATLGKIALDPAKPVHDLGEIALAPSPLGRLKGGPAPAWDFKQARGLDAKATPADFKGKWVLLMFTYGYQGVFEGTLGGAARFRRVFADRFGQFEVVIVHPTASLAEFDREATGARSPSFWGGGPLPVPLAIDNDGATAKNYGGPRSDRSVLIRPDGTVVGAAEFADLAAQLAPAPAARAWDIALAEQSNFRFPLLGDKDTGWKHLTDEIRRATFCPVEIDRAAFKAAGLDPDGPVPTVGAGYLSSWKSVVGLLLEPHGLGVAPSPDGAKLLLTKCPPLGGAPDAEQMAGRRRIEFAIEIADAVNGVARQRPLLIAGGTLPEAAARLHERHNITVAFDPALAKRVRDPNERVALDLLPGDFWRGLGFVLARQRLAVEVRGEVFWVTRE